MKINFILPTFGIAGGVRIVCRYANLLDANGHTVNVLYPVEPPQSPTDTRGISGRIAASGYRLVKRRRPIWLADEIPIRRVPTFRARKITSRALPHADATIATSWHTAELLTVAPDKVGEKFYFVQDYEIQSVWNDRENWQRLEDEGVPPERQAIEMADIQPEDLQQRALKQRVDQTYRTELQLITISEWLQTLLFEKFDRDAAVVRNPVDLDQFYPEPDEDTREPLLLLPSRDGLAEGFEEAIELIRQVSNTHPNVQFYSYGSADSSYPEFVEHRSPSDSELRRLYSNADIFVYPSWEEGWGLPPFEAMACGTAVVSTAVGGIRDHCPDNCVKRVSPRDTEALVSGVRELLESQGLRQKLAENGREFVQSYGWDKAGDQFESIVTSN